MVYLDYTSLLHSIQDARDSATCEPLDDAGLRYAAVSHTPLVLFGRSRDHMIRRSDRCSRDTDLSCYAPMLSDHNPPTLQTNGRTDGRLARSKSATCNTACHAKTYATNCNTKAQFENSESWQYNNEIKSELICNFNRRLLTI